MYTYNNFVTHPRTFKHYKWYKPIAFTLVWAMCSIAAIIGLVVCLQYAGVDIADSNRSNKMDVYTASGALLILGPWVLIILSMFVATHLVQYRPFSSYLSMEHKWNFKTFLKALGISSAIIIPITIISLLLSGFNTTEFSIQNIKFTPLGLILCILLVPGQAICEELIFRGFLMQTLGAWCRIPIVAILLQGLAFGLLHQQYKALELTSIVITGIAFGILVYITGGIEVSSAFHIVNNLVAFLISGFGVVTMPENAGVANAIFNTMIIIAFTIIFILVYQKQAKQTATLAKTQKNTVAVHRVKLQNKPN